MAKVWARIRETIERHGKAGLLSIVGAAGSVPRETGARIVLQPDGGFYGTIGGGRLEYEAPQPKMERKVEACLRLDGARILLVEDDPETLDMIKFVFDKCGAEVITAVSASEALETLERFRPDALISDIAMPDQDGYDLIRRVRSRDPERGGKIPAVAITAYTSAEDRVRTLTAGFQLHVAKPVDPEELIAMVASLTGRIHS